MTLTQNEVDQKYSKLTDREHILKRPGMTIGEVKPNIDAIFTYVPELDKIIKKNVEYSPGFQKLFDEILTNAIDFSLENASVTDIKVNIDKTTGAMSVWNNGPGIPIMEHSEHKLYIPEMIFGHLRTGSNYDDTKLRAGGGMNGIGAKAVNIFSKEFTIETVDGVKKYLQTFKNNMSIRNEPKITITSKTKTYTKVSWIPDYERFGMSGLDDDSFNLLHKRTIDSIASTKPHVKIFFNGQRIQGKSLKEYVKYYMDEGSDKNSDVQNVKKRVFYDFQTFKQSNKGQSVELEWEIAVVENETYEQVSFVNGLCTNGGGTHVKFITDKLVSKLKEYIEPKLKNKDTLKPNVIKEKLFIFVRATLVRPNFNSQTKEYLTTPVKDFGCYYQISDEFVKKIIKGTKILGEIMEYAQVKETIELKKRTDGTKKKTVFVPKLEDASLAGTSRSGECTLMLTEGDSGKTFAMRVRPNSEMFGVFPLKGKLLNVRDASYAQLLNNEEINNLKQILGLEQNKVYTSKSSLRYSRIMLLTDADCDGIHIKGLVVNLFHAWWPSLLEPEMDFICTLRTPIVKVKRGKQFKEFFTEQDYNKWYNCTKEKWHIHYYKGLGTSTKEDAKMLLPRINELSLTYYHKNEECDNSILLAFEKDKNVRGALMKYTDKRKEWLKYYNKDIYVNAEESRVSLTELVNKELIHFSNYDNIRSIPSMVDGLKPSQRKIMHYMLEKNIKQVIKVAQLAGYVSAETSYHHGENSLQQAIIGLGQDFVGSNNYNLLTPEGNFGSRLKGGGDSASPRYIFTKLEEFAERVFDKRDKLLLNYLVDDGQQIEPEFFIPVLPMILINGSDGIGTGYSTFIPPFNILNIIDNIVELLNFDNGVLKKEEPEIKKLIPWYKNFKGLIELEKPGVYVTRGVWRRVNKTTVMITELPIGTWITPYKEFLETLCDGYKMPKGEVNKNMKHPLCGLLKSVEYRKTEDENTDIQIKVEFLNSDCIENAEIVEKDLKLTKTISLNNMNLFNANGVITKYDSPEEILFDFYDLRVECYQKRKDLLLKILREQIDILENKIRFINEYLEGTLKIARQTQDFVEQELHKGEYLMLEESFDYLLNMSIRSLTQTRITSLTMECELKQKQFDELINKTKYELYLDDLNVLRELISKPF